MKTETHNMASFFFFCSVQYGFVLHQVLRNKKHLQAYECVPHQVFILSKIRECNDQKGNARLHNQYHRSHIGNMSF